MTDKVSSCKFCDNSADFQTKNDLLLCSVCWEPFIAGQENPNESILEIEEPKRG